ncbi:MAG: TIGR01777 family protein [bacterium]|nr:TIGR01777 family protein [Deltaproteobacteria bacterium]MCP4904596.1 TIGR01777 family protein [bacterium]
MDHCSDHPSLTSVLVTGATGLVGARLLPVLAERFAQIRVLSRSTSRHRPATDTGAHSDFWVDVRPWDGVDPGASALEGVDTVIHLAGEPIFGGLPTAARLSRIRASRIDSTRWLVDRFLERPVGDRPARFVSASAVGIYGDRGEEPLDESSSVGSGFLAEVCRDWEAEAERARGGGIRVVRMRIGVVLAAEGGALGLMKTPFRLGLGGRLGKGRQFFPWIQIGDLVRSILWCVEGPIEGAINAVAPEAIRNADFTRALGDVLGCPASIPMPAFVLKTLLGPISGELLGSRRVVPARLEETGFVYAHRTIGSALEAELG